MNARVGVAERPRALMRRRWRTASPPLTRSRRRPRLRASRRGSPTTSWNDAVHRREADVGDLVELVQLLHHHLADGARRRSRARPAPASAARCGRSPRRRTRWAPGACAARAGSRCASSARSKSSRDAVGLDDLRHAQLDRLVGREALLADLAAAPPADRIARLRARASRSPGCPRCCRRGISLQRSAFSVGSASASPRQPLGRPVLRTLIAASDHYNRKLRRQHRAHRARGRSWLVARRVEHVGDAGGRPARVSISAKPRVVIAGLPMRMPQVTNGFSGSLGIAFLLTVMCACDSAASASLPVIRFARRSTQEHVAVGAAGDDAQAALLQHLRQHARVLEHALLVDLEVGLQRLAEARPPWRRSRASAARPAAREDRRVDRLLVLGRRRGSMPPRGPRSVLWVVLVTKSAMPDRRRIDAARRPGPRSAPCRP